MPSKSSAPQSDSSKVNNKPRKSKASPKYEETHFVETSAAVWNYSLIKEEDIVQFQNGTHIKIYEFLGSRKAEVLGKMGVYFSVWAPNAKQVFVQGNFNDWHKSSHPLYPRWDKSGIWEGFIPGLPLGEIYKYVIETPEGQWIDKGDPMAHFWEKRPFTAPIVWDLDYQWNDKKWMSARKKHNALDQPWSVYEVHLGSWMKPIPHDEESYNSYLQLIDLLVPYVKEMGFTHVELMPVMEHPFDGSWGYQGVGYFAPTSRFGNPQEFMQLVNAFHAAGIGVILDWVPSHFPYDAHGLYLFDGEHTYEYADRKKGFHPDWNSYIFNYARGEVKSFLTSSAIFWLEKFHIDGLRVDAVSSMLKLNYSRSAGQWEPNEMGGDGNLEAIRFIKDLNETIYRLFPDVQTIAEEATDWPGVSRPTYAGGLGFGMKWMMGWMHDTLNYFKLDPIHRSHHQNSFTFSMMYYYDENFMLPLSHDEVVHGKSPMLYKMPGDEWQKFANLRLLYTYMFAHPGAKLLFMGNEFGQTSEWNYQRELDWFLLQYDVHKTLKNCIAALNKLYRSEPALYQQQFHPNGFEWVDLNHRNECVMVFRRKGLQPKNDLLIVLNTANTVQSNWTIHAAGKKVWKEIFNSNHPDFGGTGDVFNESIEMEPVDDQKTWYRLKIQIPALSALVLK